ncbi:MAG: hypothetical protein N2258_02740 [Brevinematales bacterium]|nr:hypothetical protein [Brevinematales bacterium]
MKYFISILLIISSIAFAHPPSRIKADFNLSEKTIAIEIEHGVRSKDHYINAIEILLNGKSIIKQSSSEQFNEDIQKYLYLLPELKENDKITIIAKCNKFGDMKREFVAQKQQ